MSHLDDILARAQAEGDQLAAQIRDAPDVHRAAEDFNVAVVEMVFAMRAAGIDRETSDSTIAGSFQSLLLNANRVYDGVVGG